MSLDREGQFCGHFESYTIISSKTEEYNLSGLESHRMRSHGGLSDQQVAFLRSMANKADGGGVAEL